MAKHILGEDLVRLYSPVIEGEGDARRVVDVREVIVVCYWGDPIEVIEGPTGEQGLHDDQVAFVEVQITNPWNPAGTRAAIKKKKKSKKYLPVTFRDDAGQTLGVTFLDVQQGDATLVRTPAGRHMLVDGGEGPFVARALAAAFPHTTAAEPWVLDALVVTHGDADHYRGLFELDEAREFPDSRRAGRIHTRVDRYFHNGLVKTGDDGSIAFGPRLLEDVPRAPDNYWIAELWDDPREAPKKSQSFERWSQRLTSLLAEGSPRMGPDDEALPVVKRLQYGDDDAFRVFRGEGVDVRVLGPHLDSFQGQPALPFLRQDGRLSDSHTVNGHSVILRLAFGHVSILLGGDLNEPGAMRLIARLDADNDAPPLRSEVLKVPHHGSAEFHPEFLERVAPVVSVVSSGDESPAKEYIHPRANLMAALGYHSRRGSRPLVFSTELAAFFKAEGYMLRSYRDGKQIVVNDGPEFFAFRRINFGRIHLRTDGERVVVASESAVDGVKEAYAFRVDADGSVTPEDVSML